MKYTIWKNIKFRRIYALIIAVALIVASLPINYLVYGEDGEDIGDTTFTATLNMVDEEGYPLSYSYSYEYGIVDAGDTTSDVLDSASDTIVIEGLQTEKQYTVTIHEVKDNEDNVLYAEKTVTLDIGTENVSEVVTLSEPVVGPKEEDENFKFEQESYTVAFGEDVPAIIPQGIEDGDSVTYSSGNEELVEVNPTTGELNILGVTGDAGVTITAVKAENATYLETEASYILIVTEGSQTGEFAFVESQINKVYGNATFTIEATGGEETGTITYAITGGDADAITLNGATGEVTIVGAGTVEITATNDGGANYGDKTCTCTIVIAEAQQTGEFAFADDNIEKTYGDASFIIEATGGETTGTITYAITDGDADAITLNGSTGEVTIVGVGTVEITATNDGGNNYGDKTCICTIVIAEAQQTGEFAFAESQISKVYGNATFTLETTGGEATGTITYAITDGDADAITLNTSTGEVTIVGVGTVEITATNDGGNNYGDKICTCTLTIGYRNQEEMAFTNSVINVDYSAGLTVTNPLSATGSGNGALTYSSNKESVATVDANGRVSIVGVGTVTITVNKAADDTHGQYYNPASATYTIKVSKGTQAPLYFDDAGIDGNIIITYSNIENSYSNIATGGTSEGAITYTSSNTAIASVDENGNITTYRATKAGETVTITATKAADRLYNKTSTTYTLTILKAEQSPLLFEDEPGSILYGAEYQNKIDTQSGDGDGAITYVSSDENVAEVDQNGKLTVHKVGQVTITATKASDDCYMQTSCFYTVNIKYAKISSTDAYEIDGEKKNDSEWYTSDVAIKAKEGYVLSFSDSIEQDAKWVTKLSDADLGLKEGKNKAYIHVRRQSDGAVTDIMSVTIYKDTENAEVQISNVTETTAENGSYNKDVVVSVSSSDLSGIQKIHYTVYNGDEVTQDEDIFVADDVVLKSVTDKQFTIISKKNNSDNVKYYVTVTDIAGNEVTSKAHALKIDVTKPQISVSYDNDDANKVIDDKGYFDSKRIATVVITERASNFDESKALAGIKITAVDAKGNEVSIDTQDMVGSFIKAEGATPDETTYTANISYVTDANYTFSISYTDEAGNKSKAVDYGESVAPTSFAVDTTKPTGNIYVANLGQWDIFKRPLSFLLWSKETVSVNGGGSDITSPIGDIVYYKSSETMTAEDLDKVFGWKEFDSLQIAPNEKFAVYLRITDYAGNYIYINSDGVITDNKVPTVSISVPEVKNSIYNSDVTVSLNVKDIVVNESYSGIESVSYEILNMGNITQSGTLYTYAKGDELLESWSSSIVVDKDINNSNKVKVRIYAKDNAGNQINGSVDIMIDITAPTISVSYDNNNGDTTYADNTYFDNIRTATVEIVERNFNEDDVIFTITNTDGVMPVISSWKKVEGTGNGDDTKYSATVQYAVDGDYTFDVDYTDLASNKMGGAVDYGNSLAPTTFTIDTVAPIINVSYDNNTYQNGNYYADERVATITVNEHNFETSRLVINVTASDDGVEITAPTVGQWTSNGDIHTARITFSNDGLYTLDVEYADMAGNDADDMTQHNFYVDKTAPVLSITGVADNAAYNTDGNIGIRIEATDTNFDVFTPVLTTVVKKDNTYSTVEVDGTISDINNGKVFYIENLADDGMYTLTCTVTDKAGNRYNQVYLVDADGETYTAAKTAEDILLTFSVNRVGSAYDISESTMTILNNYYLKGVEDNLVIYEVNVDPLTDYVVKLNGVSLEKDKDYTVTLLDENGTWYKYEYVINKELFEAEGEYSVIIESTDKAGTTAYSDVKQTDISFVVDKTAPSITMSGLESGGRYQVTEQTVTAFIKDDGGKVQSFKVVAYDSNGQVLKDASGEDISVRFDMSGEELEDYLAQNDGKITFTIPECLGGTVKVYCNDYALGYSEDSNMAELTIVNVTVSQSGVVIFYANKPLFYGTIIGGICLVGAIIAIIIVMIKKKNKNK